MINRSLLSPFLFVKLSGIHSDQVCQFLSTEKTQERGLSDVSTVDA